MYSGSLVILKLTGEFPKGLNTVVITDPFEIFLYVGFYIPMQGYKWSNWEVYICIVDHGCLIKLIGEFPKGLNTVVITDPFQIFLDVGFYTPMQGYKWSNWEVYICIVGHGCLIKLTGEFPKGFN